MLDIRLIPFTYPWILSTAIGDAKTILDIGCGTGELMQMLGRNKYWQVTGVDIYKKSIDKARQTKSYTKLYKADILELPREITQKKYDVVFSSQVIEHLKKKDALRLIRQMEKLAKKRVVVTTTVGYMSFSPLEEVHDHIHDDNPYQKHQSGWRPDEFTNLGFVSHGQGLFIIYREGFLAHRASKMLLPFLYGISLFFAPLVYYFPKLATYQINYKNT